MIDFEGAVVGGILFFEFGSGVGAEWIECRIECGIVENFRREIFIVIGMCRCIYNLPSGVRRQGNSLRLFQ